jgi:hypothetical protein
MAAPPHGDAAPVERARIEQALAAGDITRTAALAEALHFLAFESLAADADPATAAGIGNVEPLKVFVFAPPFPICLAGAI